MDDWPLAKFNSSDHLGVISSWYPSVSSDVTNEGQLPPGINMVSNRILRIKFFDLTCSSGLEFWGTQRRQLDPIPGTIRGEPQNLGSGWFISFWIKKRVYSLFL